MNNMILTKEISKAARALIGITAKDLAQLADVPFDTVRSFESGRTKALSAANQDAVQKALQAAGVQFIEPGDDPAGPGVALKRISD